MQLILDANRGLIIDGNWTTAPEEQALSGDAFVEVLAAARRMPEIVVTLKCKEPASAERTIDYAAIEAEFDRLNEERKQAAEDKRAEDFKAMEEGLDTEIAEQEDPEEKKTLEAGKAEKIKEWNEARDQEDADAEENDPEKPDLAEMKQKAADELTEQLAKDAQFLEEFCEALRAKKVQVIQDLETDVSAEFVHIKLLEKLKENI